MPFDSATLPSAFVTATPMGALRKKSAKRMSADGARLSAPGFVGVASGSRGVNHHAASPSFNIRTAAVSFCPDSVSKFSSRMRPSAAARERR